MSSQFMPEWWELEIERLEAENIELRTALQNLLAVGGFNEPDLGEVDLEDDERAAVEAARTAIARVSQQSDEPLTSNQPLDCG